MTKDFLPQNICISIENFAAHIIALLIILLNAGFIMLDQTLGFDLWDIYDCIGVSFCVEVLSYLFCLYFVGDNFALRLNQNIYLFYYVCAHHLSFGKMGRHEYITMQYSFSLLYYCLFFFR